MNDSEIPSLGGGRERLYMDERDALDLLFATSPRVQAVVRELYVAVRNEIGLTDGEKRVIGHEFGGGVEVFGCMSEDEKAKYHVDHASALKKIITYVESQGL
jgi:hypothetical protein